MQLCCVFTPNVKFERQKKWQRGGVMWSNDVRGNV